jgi:hypothetical protein
LINFTQGVTDLGQLPQVVMLGHEAAVQELFGPLQHMHPDFIEVKNCGWSLS